MYALISLIIILTLSMLTVRVGTVALELTGMSRDVASFQATSAFSGAGFTTQEAEEITAYPARRRVVKTLIRLGNVGIITSIASIVLSLMNAPTRPDLVLLVAGAAVVVFLTVRSAAFDRAVNPIIRRLLRRSATFELRDYTGLLRLYDDHQVADVRVRDDEWLANERLADLDLREREDVLILGIRRTDGTYVAPPSGDDTIRPGDTVIAYGQKTQLQELADRSQDRGENTTGEETPLHRRLQIQREIDPDANR